MYQMINDPFVVVIPLALLIVTVLAGLLVRRLLFTAVRRWARNSDSRLLDVSRHRHAAAARFCSGWPSSACTSPRRIPRSPSVTSSTFRERLQVLWGLSFTLVFSQAAGDLVKFHGTRSGASRAVTSLSQKLVQFSVLIVGVIWLLKVVFNFSVTPVLTALGVGGLAVALALQDTLSNLFAGFYVSVSGLVRIDDYIRLNTGEEGYITDINWRCTTMRTRFNNLVVIPNSKLGQAIYTNFFLPDGRMVACHLLIGVGPPTPTSIASKKSCSKKPPPARRRSPAFLGRTAVPAVRFQSRTLERRHDLPVWCSA